MHFQNSIRLPFRQSHRLRERSGLGVPSSKLSLLPLKSGVPSSQWRVFIPRISYEATASWGWIATAVPLGQSRDVSEGRPLSPSSSSPARALAERRGGMEQTVGGWVPTALEGKWEGTAPIRGERNRVEVREKVGSPGVCSRWVWLEPSEAENYSVFATPRYINWVTYLEDILSHSTYWLGVLVPTLPGRYPHQVPSSQGRLYQ